ncbi:MAG: DUF1016 domain-containing protein [Bacteroidales bacterium]|jgi:hypothetical protein|nr:DUF1016 domain-containing protein [Bacteroidales bacterium]
MTQKNEIQLHKDFLTDIKSIIELGRQKAYATVEHEAIVTFWKVGRRIVEEELKGEKRAAYGAKLIMNLASSLVPTYGNSYNKRNLDYYKRFYQLFPDIQIVNACVHNLGWTHVRRILSVTNSDARLWYLRAASENMWSTRELDRNIATQYFRAVFHRHTHIESSKHKLSHQKFSKFVIAM